MHRDDPEVHDDMDLAFALGPLREVAYDRRLVVGVSGRSVRGHRQLRRRLDRAVHTLEVNWAVQPPWLRWQERLEARRTRMTGSVHRVVTRHRVPPGPEARQDPRDAG